MSYGWGTIGHTSMHHAFEGGFERGKSPACDSGKSGGRIIRMPDPDKTCGKCRRIAESSEVLQATSESSGDSPDLPSLMAEPYERRQIALGDTFVDIRCQRDEQVNWSNGIGANFRAEDFADDDPRLADRQSCEGGLGPNGERYAILDHQHQINGAKIAGYPLSTLFHAKVYVNLTLPRQAGTFRRVNNQRHAVKALSDFSVAITEGETQALRIVAELEINGLTYGSAGADGRIAAVGRLRKADNLGVLAPLLNILTGSWGNRHEASNSKVLDGLILILSRPRSDGKPCSVDTSHLISRLKRVSPEQVIRAGSSKDAAGKTAKARAANFIADQYNTGLRIKPKLDYYR